MKKPTTASKGKKPAKPYADFPLFPHATGRWAKKIRGKLHYFGPWADWKAALEKYKSQKDDLHAGRTPRAQTGGLQVRDLLNRFLAAKEMQRDSGEIVARTFEDYHTMCARVGKAFGLTRLVSDLASDDFEKLRADISKTRGGVALGNDIQRVRTLFKYAFDAGLIDRPIRFGPAFKRPSKKHLRKIRNAQPERMFEADEIRRMLAAATRPVKAMILLGINCGFGNSDCGNLPLAALDLDGGFVTFPRPKTGVKRRCPLWPETVEALRDVLARRRQPRHPAHAGLVFISRLGLTWFKDTADSPITTATAKLLDTLGIARAGRGFYALRHTFETIGGDSRDQIAVNFIMGHVDLSMAATYRERIEDARLKAVTDHVHDWLFPTPAKGKKGAKRKG